MEHVKNAEQNFANEGPPHIVQKYKNLCLIPSIPGQGASPAPPRSAAGRPGGDPAPAPGGPGRARRAAGRRPPSRRGGGGPPRPPANQAVLVHLYRRGIMGFIRPEGVLMPPEGSLSMPSHDNAIPLLFSSSEDSDRYPAD